MSGQKTISHCQGKGSLAHNNREFRPKNVNSARSPDNVTFVKIPIAQAYEDLFGAAVERYNAKQKRNDRKIKKGYFEYQFNHKVSQNVITSSDKRHSFYEDVVQIGTMTDTGVGTPDAKIAAECLTEYMSNFQTRNPNFHVFNAVLHLDEATPHLHIDYIPVGHYSRGVDTQNGIAQALKEMGYGEGKNAIARWRQSEYEVLREICIRHGLEISEPKTSRGSMTVETYKEVKRLEEQLAPLQEYERIAGETEISYKKSALSKDKVVISKADYDTVSEEKKAAAVQREMARQETERNAEQKKRLDEREKEIDEWIRVSEEKIDRKRSSAESMYNKQRDLNETLVNLQKSLDYYKYKASKNLNYEQEIDKLKRKNEDLRMIHQEEIERIKNEHSNDISDKSNEIYDLERRIEKLLREIETLKSTISEKDTKIEEIRKEKENCDLYIDTLYEVGEYACKRLGVDINRAMDMRINRWNLSRCFENSGIQK